MPEDLGPKDFPRHEYMEKIVKKRLKNLKDSGYQVRSFISFPRTVCRQVWTGKLATIFEKAIFQVEESALHLNSLSPESLVRFHMPDF
jgi:hypothetical protein